MIVLAAQALRFASLALPLLLSMRGALPSLPLEGLAQRSGAAAGAVLDVLAAAEKSIASSGWTCPTMSAQAGESAGSDAAGSSSTTSTKPRASGAKKGSGEASAEEGGPGSSTEGAPDRDSEDDPEGRFEHGDDRSSYEEEHGLHRSSTPDVSFGSSPVHIAPGEYHRGDLICIGGDVNIEGEVRGDVVVVGGVLSIQGKVHGGVVAVASRVFLGEGVRIRRDFVSVAGPVTRSPDVRIGGEYHSIDLPNLGRFATGHGVFVYLMSLFLWVALIVTAFRFLAVLVVAAVAPARIERALAAPRPSWILAFLLGFAVQLFAALLGFLLVAACVTSPIGVALWLAVRVGVWMGLASIYLEIGRNLSRAAFRNQLSYFGSILLGFAVFAVVGIIPIVGWFITAILSCVALGLMLLTRFGSGPRAAAAPVAPGPAPSGAPAAGPLTGAAPAPGSAV